MTEIYSPPQIEAVLPALELVDAIEASLAAYSRGEVVVGPVGELVFTEPPGDVHLKYGYLRGDDVYVVKIASGFYDNPSLGLPSSDGLVLVFSRRTGEAEAILLDRGRLTDARTGAAGAVAARHLAPEHVERIGVVGTGTQAWCQLRAVSVEIGCHVAAVWGRNREAADRLARELEAEGWEIGVAATPAEAAADADIVITTTPAPRPLLTADAIAPGTLVIAVGADSPGKQELDPRILGAANLVVADSRSQCRERGEIAHALAAGEIVEEEIVELGEIVADEEDYRTAADGLTVVDLTGVAAEDIAIAKAILTALGGGGGSG